MLYVVQDLDFVYQGELELEIDLKEYSMQEYEPIDVDAEFINSLKEEEVKETLESYYEKIGRFILNPIIKEESVSMEHEDDTKYDNSIGEDVIKAIKAKTLDQESEISAILKEHGNNVLVYHTRTMKQIMEIINNG